MSRGRRSLVRTLGIAAGAAFVLFVVGPWVYINFISDEAPPPLTLPPAGSPTTTAGSGGPTTSSDPSRPLASLDGTWRVGPGSEAGYRVVEVLFGQDNTAVGRTSSVTGTMQVSGTTVSAATVTVDLATVTSDESRRDGQFRGRIMDTANFPTATFALNQAISVPELPVEGVDVNVQAPGRLTLRGMSRNIVADLTARRTGSTVAVQGTIEVVFADYGIPDPSFSGVTTRDRGTIEFLLNFVKA